jgi:hypothetical protein
MIGLLKNLKATGKSCYAKSRISYEANSKGIPSVPLRIANGQDYDKGSRCIFDSAIAVNVLHSEPKILGVGPDPPSSMPFLDDHGGRYSDIPTFENCGMVLTKAMILETGLA